MIFWWGVHRRVINPVLWWGGLAFPVPATAVLLTPYFYLPIIAFSHSEFFSFVGK